MPESKPALELFDSFRVAKRSFALTVDEYGGVTGLVTMEDLLEGIFGDIPNPSDEIEQFQILELGENRYSVEGAIPLEEFNRKFNVLLAEGEMETLGGFVLHTFGELPLEGAMVDIDSFRFTAAKVAQNRIVELQVEQLQESAAQQQTAPQTDDETPGEEEDKS